MILKNLRRRRVAVVGFDPAEADSISRSFASADAIARVVVPGPSLPGTNPYAYYDVCVVNCIASDEEGSPIRQVTRSRQPVLLIGEAEAVAQMTPTFSGVMSDFTTRPYRSEELLLRADRLIGGIDANVGAAARNSSQRRALVAEDEEVTNALIVTILKSAGFECASARDGLRAIEIVKE